MDKFLKLEGRNSKAVFLSVCMCTVIQHQKISMCNCVKSLMMMIYLIHEMNLHRTRGFENKCMAKYCIQALYCTFLKK